QEGKIAVGQVFNSEKELIECVGLSYNGQNSKKARIKELKRRISYDNVEGSKRKIVVTEIFDKPKAKEDGRSMKQPELQNEFLILLSDYIKSNAEDNLEYSYRNMLYWGMCCLPKELGFFMAAEVDGEVYPPDGFTKYTWYVFSDKYHQICYETVWRRLERLEQNGAIEIRYAYRLDKELHWDNTRGFKIIDAAQKATLEKVGLQNPGFIWRNPKHRDEYIKNLQEELTKEFPNSTASTLRKVFSINLIDLEVSYTESELEEAQQKWQMMIGRKILNGLRSKQHNDLLKWREAFVKGDDGDKELAKGFAETLTIDDFNSLQGVYTISSDAMEKYEKLLMNFGINPAEIDLPYEVTDEDLCSSGEGDWLLEYA
ncbi:MAG: hypothetical protein MJ132_08305, partial [Clostridia bacterium]|nr:hypothetical protein [Clostridia bacterium]